MRSYLLTIIAACSLWCSSTSAADKAPLSPCKIPDLDRPARCGVFEVPENREQPNGRRLKIHVAVVPGGTAGERERR